MRSITSSTKMQPDEPFADLDDRWFFPNRGTINYADPVHKRGKPEESPTSAQLNDASLMRHLERAKANDVKLRLKPTEYSARDRYMVNKMMWDLFAEAVDRGLVNPCQ